MVATCQMQIFPLMESRIENLGDPIQENNAANKIYVDDAVENILEQKFTNNMFPVDGQIITASSQFSTNASHKKENAFDNSDTTQWVSKSASENWIQVEIPVAKRVWKLILKPRLGSQRTDQYFTKYRFEAKLNEADAWTKLAEGTNLIFDI